MSTTVMADKSNKLADHLKPAIAPAPVTLGALVGSWINVNSATQGIVNAYGACSPTR